MIWSMDLDRCSPLLAEKMVCHCQTYEEDLGRASPSPVGIYT